MASLLVIDPHPQELQLANLLGRSPPVGVPGGNVYGVAGAAIVAQAGRRALFEFCEALPVVS